MPPTSDESLQPAGSWDPAQDSASPVLGHAAAGGPAPRTALEESNDAEIDQYMRDLLGRLNRSGAQTGPASGTKSPASPAAPATPPRAATPAPPRSAATPTRPPAQPPAGPRTARPTTSTATDATTASSTHGAQPAPRNSSGSAGGVAIESSPRPRAVAPESAEDMSVLRELANLSTTDALATYASRRMRDRAWRHLTVALIAAAIATVLDRMSDGTESLFLWASRITAFVAAVCLAQFAWFWFRAVVSVVPEPHTRQP